MTSFRRWWRGKFASASQRRRATNAADEAVDGELSSSAEDDGKFSRDRFAVTERTRRGVPWIVVDRAETETIHRDGFFDDPCDENVQFVVSERTRSGDTWIVVDHAVGAQSTCITSEKDDFFDTPSNTSTVLSMDNTATKFCCGKDFFVAEFIDAKTFGRCDQISLKAITGVPARFLQSDCKKIANFDDQFVVTERTRHGEPWIIVDLAKSRSLDPDGFFDDPVKPTRQTIPDGQLVLTEKSRCGEPWLVIDLPIASSSSGKHSEESDFFDLVPTLGKFDDITKRFSRKPEVDLQRYFHLNDSGDLRVISFGVKVVRGSDSYSGPWRWWKGVTVGVEAKERSRSLWGRFVHRLKKFWRKYVSSPRTAGAFGSGRCGSGREAPGARVRRYALQLARDKSTTFAQNVDHFIACTRDGRERQPHVVMRNMRQFMSGMKNYLLKHGERGFEREVQLARARLRGDEFLNLDALLESVMQRLVAVPLREHLYALFVEWCAARGDIELMAENIKLAAEYEPRELGLRACVSPPSGTQMAAIAEQLTLLQEAESPLDKLDRLLRAVALVFEGTGGIKVVSADDFLPLLILVIARCGLVGAEIESELMWGLLQPSLLSGEAGYYLTALSSAVHVLKSLGAGSGGAKEQPAATALNAMETNADRPRGLPACSGSLLRVVVPDEHHGSLQTRTLPVRPHTTAREVCRIIAHRARVTNPQDYGLFKLVDGEESLLADGECPQEARLSAEGKHCVLAYKRIDAKIAWPTAALVTDEDDC